MSFLDFFLWKEKPKVVLAPEAPVKAPEVLVTLKQPVPKKTISMLEQIQQADSAARVTPKKTPTITPTPVTPRRSMLEQIQNPVTNPLVPLINNPAAAVSRAPESFVPEKYLPVYDKLSTDQIKSFEDGYSRFEKNRDLIISAWSGILSSGKSLFGAFSMDANKSKLQLNEDLKTIDAEIKSLEWRNDLESRMRLQDLQLKKANSKPNLALLDAVEKKTKDLSLSMELWAETLRDDTSGFVKWQQSQDFKVSNIITPEFWTGTVSQQAGRMIPDLAILALPLPGGKIKTWSKIINWLASWVTTLTKATASRFYESKMEAEQVFDELQKSGFDDKYAHEKASQVFQDDMKLVWTDIIQFWGSKIIKPKYFTAVPKVLKRANDYFLNAAAEVVEELYQNDAQTRAKKTTSEVWDDQNTVQRILASLKTAEGRETAVISAIFWLWFRWLSGVQERSFNNLRLLEAVAQADEIGTNEAKDVARDMVEETFKEDGISKSVKEKLVAAIDNIPVAETEAETTTAPVTPTAPATTITTKQSNALNQKVDTTDTQSFIDSSKKVLEDQGYTVETKDGLKQKGSLSKYLLVSKEGGKQVVVRVSDHSLPDTYVEKYGTPAVAIDLSARKVMPFDTISEAVSGKEVKVVPQEQSYKASDRLKEFEAIKDNLSDAQLVQYDVTKKEEALYNAINDEMVKRNISEEDQIALGDTPVEKYVAPVATTTATTATRRKSFLEQAQEAETTTAQTEAVLYSPEMQELLNDHKSAVKMLKDTRKKNQTLTKSKQLATKHLIWNIRKAEQAVHKQARLDKVTDPLTKTQAAKATPQEVATKGIAEFNEKGSAQTYLTSMGTRYINGKMKITEYNDAMKLMKAQSPSQAFLDEVLAAEAAVIFQINEELRALEAEQDSTGDYALQDILEAKYQEVSYNDIKAIQKEAIRKESGDMNSLPPRMKEQIDLMALETDGFQDDIFNEIMEYDFSVDERITKRDRRYEWLNKKLAQFTASQERNAKATPVVVTPQEGTQSPFNIPESLSAAVDEITNYREDMLPIEQISYAIESAANSRVARIEVSKILETLDATPDTAQAFLDYADSRKRNEVDPLSNEAFSWTPFELKEKEARDIRIQDAFTQGDYSSIVENVGVWGTFSVSWMTTTPASLIGKVQEITSEEYRKRTGDKLLQGDVAYEVITEFVPKETSVDIQFKSGFGFSMRNLWTGVKLTAQGIPTGNVIAPLLTLNKWATRKALWVFGVRHILGVVYDKATGRNGTQLLSSFWDEQIANTRALADLEDTYETFDKEIFSRSEEISKAFSKLVTKIDELVKNPTNNTLTGEAYSKQDRETLWKVILSFGVDSTTLWDSKELSPLQKNTLYYSMALAQAFSYYPKEMRSIMGNDLADFFLSDFMKETTARSLIYTTWWNSLVQMKEAGLKQEDVISGTYHPGANIDPTQALLTSEERSYQHFHINGNVVAYLIKNNIIPKEFEGQDIEQIIAFLTMQQSLETNAVAKEQIGNQLKRIRDVITKAKGQDNLDLYRLHFPLMQKYIYAKHVANVIYQKETIKLLQWVDTLMPDTITSGKWAAGLVEDIFIGDKKTMTYQEAKRLEAIYGEWTIMKDRVDNLKAVAKSTGEVSAKLASFGLSTSKSLVKWVVTLAYSFIDPRVETVRITGNKNYEDFAVMNGLISGKWKGLFQRGTDDFKLNLEHARAQLETSKKLWEVTDANGTYTVITSIWETARGGITNFMFANAIEEMVAYKAGQLHFMDEVSAITGKTYQSDMKVNMEEVMTDFETLSTTQKEDIIDSTKAYMARNYDTQTQTKSTIRFLRMNELNFLRNYMTKLVANSVLRTIDTKTYKNLDASKPHTQVAEENNTADLTNDVSNAISPDERLSKNTKTSMNLLRQQAIVATLLMAAYMGIKELTWDDEDKEKDQAYYASLFEEAFLFVTTNFMNVAQNTTTALLQPVSLGAGFSVQYMKTFGDLLYQKFVTKSQTGYDQEWYKFAKMNGVIGQALDLSFNTAAPQSAMTSTGKVTYIREAGFTPWLLESALPGNVSYSSQQAAQRAIMWERAKWIGLLGELIGDWVDVTKQNAEMALSNMKNSIFPKKTDTTDKHQAYYAADLLIRAEEIIRENPDLNLNQVIKKMYEEKGISQLGLYDIFGKVLGWVKTMDAKNKKIEAILNEPKLLMNKGFTFNAKEKASVTWNNIMQNPQVALGFTSLLVDLDALKEWSVSEEATLKKNISEPNSKSYLGSALAIYQKSPRFANTMVRNIEYSVDGMRPDKNATREEMGAYMDRLELILSLGANNPSLQRDIYKSLQNALASKVMEGSMYEIVLANSTANAGKYPFVNQALVLQADDRSLTNKEYNAIKAGELNYEVSQKLIQANGGKMPNTDQKKAPPEGGYKKGDTILAPIHGVVGRQENGVIYITDYMGRHLAFTPFISELKDGDVVKAGQKIGEAKSDTKITIFKDNAAPARQPKEPLVEIDPTKNYNKDYIEQTGNMETLKNFDYRKYVDAIDFWALSRSIWTWKKTKPKAMKKVAAPKAQKSLPRKQSILQDFLDSEGK
jgi:hypothetical protein